MKIKAALKDNIACWDKLTEAQQETLIENTAAIHYHRKESIHNVAMDCFGVLIVLSGTLRIYINSPDGREVTLYRLQTGNICLLAATCILKSITFDVYIDAVTDCEIVRTNSSAFSSVMKKNVYLEAFTYREAVDRFSDAVWALQQILFLSFDKRLALFLLHESKTSNSLTINMTHEQIARFLGSAREVVTRMLKYFSTEGLVTLSRGKVNITSLKGLEKLTR
jgi:CRP/FNR family transcriptional regulator